MTPSPHLYAGCMIITNVGQREDKDTYEIGCVSVALALLYSFSMLLTDQVHLGSLFVLACQRTAPLQPKRPSVGESQ